MVRALALESVIMPDTRSPKRAGEDRIKFQFPPLNEVAIGVHFPPILELKSQHIGRYWESIRSDFSICEQQAPQFQPTEGNTDPTNFPQLAPGEIFPLQRFWFYGESSPMLVQVQRDAFWLNWRRVPNGTYPHFEVVEEEFWKRLAEFRSFVESIGGKLEIASACDLSYVNLIGFGKQDVKPSDFAEVVPTLRGFIDTEKVGRKLLGLISTTTYLLGDNLFVDVASKLGKRLDTQEQAMLLELKARGTPTGYSWEGAQLWFQAAHQGIYELFLELTAEKTQHEVWKVK